MTLLTERPQRGEFGVALEVPVPTRRPELARELVLPDVYRVTDGDAVVGYIEIAGPVFVGLRGAVYNTSVEVGQHLDLDAACRNLAEHWRGETG